MEIIFFAVILGILVGMIAKSKGREFFPWWLYGSLIFIVAIVHVLLIKPDEKHAEREALASGSKKCPRCAELVKREASICRFCRYDFESAEITGSRPRAPAALGE
jgi:hypothetical protein